ncbi:MAG: tetratricopeptide repeat protein [candidate division WOR-3 bacterium]
MKRRLKRGIVIYLIFLGAGFVAYFGIQAAKGKYSVSGGEINIFGQTKGADTLKPKTGIRVPGPGEAIQMDTAGKTFARKDSTTKPMRDTTARLFTESTATATATADTTSKINPSPGGIKPTSGGKSDFPEIKPAVDLSSSGGLDIKIKPGEGIGGSGSDLGLGGGPQLKIGTGEQLGVGKSGDTKSGTSASSGTPSSNAEVLKMEKELESTYRNAHDLDKTLSLANQILKMDPNNAKAAFYAKIVKTERKALAYEDSGEPAKALAEWKKILSWDPGNRWAQKGVERNE